MMMMLMMLILLLLEQQHALQFLEQNISRDLGKEWRALLCQLPMKLFKVKLPRQLFLQMLLLKQQLKRVLHRQRHLALQSVKFLKLLQLSYLLQLLQLQKLLELLRFLKLLKLVKLPLLQKPGRIGHRTTEMSYIRRH